MANTAAPSIEDFANALAAQKAMADKAANEKAEKEAAAWTAKGPALVESIKARIGKMLTKDLPNGKELRVLLGGDEMRYVHEWCVKGISPPGINVGEIQHEHLMKTGKNLGGISFVPDTRDV